MDGDQQAWAELVGFYTSRLFALANSRLRRPDLAEEVVQSVFATVAAKLNTASYAEQGQFEAWLFRIAINRIRDQIRASRRSLRTSALESAENQVSTKSVLVADRDESDGLRHVLREALQNLSEKDRDIIELRHHAQMSFKQIADVLDEPVGTLLARHHRALAKLRDLVAAQQPAQSPPGSLTPHRVSTISNGTSVSESIASPLESSRGRSADGSDSAHPEARTP
jgi:RNA polymerase sigma-70 factor (ECF subfamily)